MRVPADEGLDVEDLAKAVGRAHDRAEVGVEAAILVDERRQPARLGEVEHRVALGGGERHGLFENDMSAGLERALGPERMRVGWCRHHDELHVRLLEERVGGLEQWQPVNERGRGGAAFGVGVGHGGQSQSWRGPDCSSVLGADSAEAEQPDADVAGRLLAQRGRAQLME